MVMEAALNNKAIYLACLRMAALGIFEDSGKTELGRGGKSGLFRSG
jgi:hypothetical protein